MEGKRPSQTAALVALMRALAEEGFTRVPGFRDPYARQLLSPAWSLLYRLAKRVAPEDAPPWLSSLYEGRDYMPLRTLAIDEELLDAIRRGVRQIVLLGAGLDTRAHRLDVLQDVAVFEVDHPATQAHKVQKAASLPRRVRSLAYVPVDFERDALLPRLAGAGHDPTASTVWVWEGVIMYLSDSALRATLQSIAEGSARGSILLAHYHEAHGGAGRRAIDALLSLWREPQIGERSRATVAEELRRAGFTVLRDTGADDWADHFGAPRPIAKRGLIMRLAVATK
jgi:methyltransferase (TIGR00027 family)